MEEKYKRQTRIKVDDEEVEVSYSSPSLETQTGN